MLVFHLDLKRAMWRPEYLERILGQLGGWGFTTILCEFEDKLRFRNHPDIAHPDAWSHEEARKFVENCRSNGIDVIPMIQTLGHAEAVVGKPAYAHLREQPDVIDQYDPLSDEARALIFELIDEVIGVFQPRNFIHIGGDETWALGKSEKCRALVAQIGTGGLYLHHMRPVFDHVRPHGLRPMLWADIVLQHAELLEQIPREVVLVDWDYSRRGERSEKIIVWGIGERNWEQIQALPDSPAKQLALKHAVDDRTCRDGTLKTFYRVEALRSLGFDVVTASAARSAGDTMAMPRAEHLENVASSTRAGLTAGLGEIVTNWAVRHNHPELTMPSVFGASWTLRHQEYDQHEMRHSLLNKYCTEQFGMAAPELDEAWRLLSPVVPFSEMMSIQNPALELERGGNPMETYLDALRNKDMEQLGSWNLLRSSLPDVKGQGDKSPDDWIVAARTLTASRRDGYLRAGKIIADVAVRARKGHEILDYWKEAADISVFYADFALSLLNGTLAHENAPLLERMLALRRRTRELWRRTYTNGSIEEELRVRYGFQEACLKTGIPETDSIMRRSGDADFANEDLNIFFLRDMKK